MSFIYQPNASATQTSKASKTFTSAGPTVVVPIFRVTGCVRVLGIWGVVTSTIGTNHINGAFRVYDGTLASPLSSSSANKLDCSNYAVGSLLEKVDLANAPLKGINSTASGFLEPAGGAGQQISSPFDVVAKIGVATNIEYTYATSNASGGAIEFFVQYLPFSVSGVGGTIVAI